MDDPKHESQAHAQKREYTPPAIDDSAAFETLALTCGKIDQTCQYAPGGYSQS